MLSDEHIPETLVGSQGRIELNAHLVLQIFSPETIKGKKPFDIKGFCELGRMRELTGVSFVVEKSLGEDYGEQVLGEVVGNELRIIESVYQELEHNVGRARFTLAHELGHVMLHRDISTARDLSRLNFKPSGDLNYKNNPEKQADYFAACLLMPKAGVAKALRSAGKVTKTQAIDIVCTAFQVGRSAAKWRVQNLEKKGFVRLQKEKAGHRAQQGSDPSPS